MTGLRICLDPFCLFRKVGTDAGAARYNRDHRRILLVYMLRWAVIGGLCFAAMEPLIALAAREPVLVVPIVGLELGFSAGLFFALLSLGVYVALGLED